jgi:hypothetical protein
MIERLRRLRRPRVTVWRDALAAGIPPDLPPRTGPRVLHATSVGGHSVAPVLDSLVAMALWLRGADPHFLLCDSALPACELAQYTNVEPSVFVERGPRPLCGACFARGTDWLAPLPPPLHRYGDFSRDESQATALQRVAGWTVEDCFTFVEQGLRLGEQARANTIRYFGKADLSTEPQGLVTGVARRYAAGALVTAAVAQQAIEQIEPDVVVAHHGIYVPQGVIGEVARRAGVRVVNWGTSYRDRTAIFSHGDTYHRTFLHDAAELWDVPLTAEAEQELLEFLALRRRGEGDWQWVTPEAALRRVEQDEQALREQLALDPAKPTVGLLTNVLWDAQLYYEGHAFADMLDWLWFTIDFFASHPELQLLIRIHPHEIKAGNRQPVGPELARRYPELPSNIRVVAYDDPANTYALMDLCSAVLIYGTKTGVELAPFGKPVVVAADAWIRGKGLTHDVSSRDEYAAALGAVGDAAPLDEATIARARRYAYYFFFRRMIPISSFEPGRANLELAIRSLADILPGRDPGLDRICRGILDGEEFVFDG